VGAAVWYSDDPEPSRPGHGEAIGKLANELSAGLVDTLVVLGGNPAFDVPGDLDFAKKLSSVKNTIRLGLYDDETSLVCRWHVPQAHYLEAWGDARGWDGTAGIVQPLIEPLYDGLSAIELCAMLIDGTVGNGYELVRRTWSGLLGAADFDKAWRLVVHDGVHAGSRSAKAAPTLVSGSGDPVKRLCDAAPKAAGSMEVIFSRSFGLYDGRFGNLGWLVELPDPITKLTWDNAALLSPADAAELNVTTGDLVTVTIEQSKLEIPAFVVPGQAKGSMTLALGWGRTAAGRIGTGIGVDVNGLRRNETPWLRTASVVRAGGHVALATTQDHHIVDTLGKREQAVRAEELIRTGTLHEFKAHPEFAKEMVHLPKDAPLWKEHEYNGHKWGMAIDLTACTGCHACTIACQAENNIPVVGKSRCGEAARCTGSRRPLLRGRARSARSGVPADGLPSLRERALRAGLPGRRDRARPRRAERDGLQPLRRHAVLLQQLPVQGAALQLVQQPQERIRRSRHGLQPRGHGPRARRHGEVHRTASSGSKP
jgi:molybdopterin-containing oxidoreductase family iron-sulfur binding subunit